MNVLFVLALYAILHVQFAKALRQARVPSVRYGVCSYQKIARTFMKTGDIVLFDMQRSPSAVQMYKAMIYRGADGTCWGHSGVIIRRPADGALFVYESNPSRHYDELLGTRVFGIHLVPLEERLRTYGGRCAWRPLPRVPEQCTYERAMEYVDARHLSAYCAPHARMLPRYLHDMPSRAPATMSFLIGKRSIYCSQLAGDMLCHLGIMASQPRGALWIPSDLTDEARVHFFHPMYEPVHTFIIDMDS